MQEAIDRADRLTDMKDEPLKKMLGFCYVEWGPQFAEDQDVTDLYSTIGEYHEVFFDAIPIPVTFTEDDPYQSYEEMRNRVFQEGELFVYSGGSHPPGMTKEQNLKGRAVHDWFGHLQYDVDFSFEGEFLKWWNTKAKYPRDVQNLLFTEIVLQRCAVSYLPDGFSDERFEQHAFEAPPAWINGCIEKFIEQP